MQRAFDSTPASCLAAGDLDGDGILDLMGANWIALQIMTMLGNGDGTFRDGPSMSTYSTPFHLTLADFDEDGVLDLAVPEYSFGVFVFIGQGDGTFGPGLHLLPTTTPYFTEAADLNEDGHLDLVIGGGAGASTISLTIYILPGNGDGTFGAPLTAVADLNPVSLAVADVNNDSHLDIVSANFDAYDVAVIAGKGDGTFAPALLYGAGQAPASVLTTDLNNDGRPDIVTTNRYSHDLTIALHAPY
jgi:hypothetical protein